MIVLALGLFGSATFADDGDQGGGNNQTCTINCPPPPCTIDCPPVVQGVNDEETIITANDYIDTTLDTLEVAPGFWLF
jgi:hypothetical protein